MKHFLHLMFKYAAGFVMIFLFVYSCAVSYLFVEVGTQNQDFHVLFGKIESGEYMVVNTNTLTELVHSFQACKKHEKERAL